MFYYYPDEPLKRPSKNMTIFDNPVRSCESKRSLKVKDLKTYNILVEDGQGCNFGDRAYCASACDTDLCNTIYNPKPTDIYRTDKLDTESEKESPTGNSYFAFPFLAEIVLFHILS